MLSQRICGDNFKYPVVGAGPAAAFPASIVLPAPRMLCGPGERRREGCVFQEQYSSVLPGTLTAIRSPFCLLICSRAGHGDSR